MATAMPVQGFRFTGNLVAAGSTDATAVVCAPGKSRGGGIQLSGTFVGTVQFEQSLDNGTTWISKTVYPAAGGAGVTSATATGQWKFKAGGETYIRVRCSAFTSGPITVDIVLTAGEDAVVGGGGTAGTPSGGVQSVQGVSGGTALAVAEKGFSSIFATLTRPTNTTAYAANDSISDNATAGSVTALVATVSDTNDAPVILTSIEVATTDTGLGAGVSIRAYVYNSDPTANSGVGGGDNAAFSNKQAGLVSTFVGTFHAMADGGKAFLAPEDSGPTIAHPATGAKTMWIQYQTLGAFTPSANSTTLIGKAKGYQLRA